MFVMIQTKHWSARFLRLSLTENRRKRINIRIEGEKIIRTSYYVHQIKVNELMYYVYSYVPYTTILR